MSSDTKGLDDEEVKKPYLSESIETDFGQLIMEKRNMYSRLISFDKTLSVKDFLTYTPAEVVQLFALNYTEIKIENEPVGNFVLELGKASLCYIDDSFPLTFDKTIEAQLLDLPEDVQYQLIQGGLVFDDSDDNNESSERHFVLPSNPLQINFEGTDTELKKAFQPFHEDPMLYQTDSLDVWLPYTVDLADVRFMKDIVYDLYMNKAKLNLKKTASSAEEQFEKLYRHILNEVYSHTEGLPKFVQDRGNQKTFLQQWEEQLREQRLKIKQLQKKTDKDYEKYEILKYFVDKSFVQEMNRYRKTNSVPYRFLVRFFRSKST